MANTRWTYEVRAGKRGQPGRSWSDKDETGLGLNLQFTVTKKLEKRGSKLSLTLTNLSGTSLSFLEEPGTFIILSAGYNGNNRLLFSGEIARRGVESDKQGETRTTTIEASSGEIVLVTTRFDRSFNEGATLTDVISAIASDLGVGVRLNQFPNASRTTFGTGFAFFGMARDALDEVVGRLGAKWSLQDGSLIILRGDQTLAETAPLLSPRSGLIGSPTHTKDGVGGEAQLDGRIAPGKEIVIESAGVNGIYKITEVTHSGEYRGSSWRTSFKGKLRAT